MITLLLAVAPIVIFWILSLAFAWCTAEDRRGALQQRRADIRRAKPHPSQAVVDLSRDAAARLVGLRVGACVRAVAYVLLVVAVLARFPWLLIPVTLWLVVWIDNKWSFVANLAYYALMQDAAFAFHQGAWAYNFPGHEEETARARREAWLGSVLQTIGVALILCVGLPLAYRSDTIPSPFPGLYIQHSHMPWWAIGLILFAVGGSIAWSGTRLERRVRRRAMRRVSALVPRPDRSVETIVFLRPFESDRLTVQAHPGPRRDGVNQLLPKRTEFLEDVATWLLWSRGEVVAISDPRRRAGTLGAAHHAVPPGRDWMSAVSELLERAAAIVLIPGTSPGVTWEVHQVLHTPRYLHKTLLLNPEPHDPCAGAFLSAIGMPPLVVAPLGRPRVILGAVHGAAGRQLLCSSLGQDVDYDAAVEWFLRRTLVEQGSAAAIPA